MPEPRTRPEPDPEMEESSTGRLEEVWYFSKGTSDYLDNTFQQIGLKLIINAMT